MSTINTTINHGITLGTPGYYSPLSVTAAGYITNNGTGYPIRGSGGTVVNDGRIVATGTNAYGGNLGIYLTDVGAVTNHGTITASGNAVALYRGGSLDNSGTLLSGHWGVHARATVAITNSGTINGASNAINIYGSGGSLNNSGLVIGADGLAAGGSVTVVNSGTIIGTYGAAIAISGGGTMTNLAGALVQSNGAFYIGVLISGIGTVTNAGTISGNTAISLPGSYSHTVVESGTIIGSGGTAIAFGTGNDLLELQPGDLLIQGRVDGGGGTDVLRFDSGASTGTLTGVGASFTGFETGTVVAGAHWVLAGNSTLESGMTLTNSGTFDLLGTAINAGAILSGVTLLVGGTLSVAATGLVAGGATAAVNALASSGTAAFFGGSVVNDGTISNTATAASQHGRYAVAVGRGSTLTNRNLATAAGYGAVYVLGGGVDNRGSVLGGQNGVVAESGAVGNSGLISAAGAGVISHGRMFLGNAGGTITGAMAAALVNSYATNSGTFAGTAGVGIQLTQGGTLRNDLTGLVSGSGAYAGLSISGAGFVLNLGTITGGTGIAVDSAGTASQLVANIGTIIGNLGTAIAFGAGDDTLLLAGSLQSIQGLVDAGAGTDTLELHTLGGGGTVTGLGVTLLGFEIGTVDAGAAWTMAGSNTIGAGMTLVDSGVLTDTGTLINGGGIAIAAAGLGVAPGGYLRNDPGGTIVVSSPGGTNPAVVGLAGGVGTVVNQGTITNQNGHAGLSFAGSGLVTNGSTADATALISGGVGVYGVAYNTSLGVINFGTIAGSGGTGSSSGIVLGRGSVTNGAAGHTAALITGTDYGILGSVYTPVVANFGTVLATGTGGFGVRINGGSTITNGSAGDGAALIQGAVGVEQVSGTVTNFGTIAGSTTGILFQAGGTVVDAGTIIGSGGPAIEFDAGNSLLVLQGGFAITGAITAAGTGNVVQLSGSEGAPVVANYNSLALTGFGTVAFAAGAGNYATLIISNAASLPGSIAGFIGLHDTIDLTGLSDAGNDASTSFNSTTNVLTVIGSSGTVDLQLAAQSYAGIGWVAENDGTGGTAVHAQAIAGLSIAGTAGGQAVNDDATVQPFAAVTLTDPNGASLVETVTITLRNGGTASDADGTLTGSSLSRTGVGTYTLTAPGAAAAQAALRALVFTPTANQVAPGGTVATTFQIDIADALGGSGSDATTSVAASSVDDAPSITGTAAGQAVNDDATILPFSAVSIGDPDVGASETVTITLRAGGAASDANGTLSGTGLSKAGVGTYTLAAGSPAAVTAALRAVTFTPEPHEVAPGGTVTTGITLSVSDGIAGSPTTDATTTVVATAVNGPPAISGTRADQGVPGQAASMPFATVVISDPEVGHVDTVTVAMSAPAAGAFSNLGGGSYDAAAGTYSITGTPAQVTAALAALTFTPAPPASGLLATTAFTITVQGPGGTVTDTATRVTSALQVYGLAGAPNPVVAVSPDGTGLPAAVGGQTDEAVILAPAAGGSFAVPDLYRAVFLGGTTDVTLTSPGSQGALLAGNAGNDTIFAGPGSDTVVTGTGANQVVLGAGNAFVASAGQDEIDGGSGAATITTGANSAILFLGTGTSSVNAGAGGASTVVSGSSSDTIVAHGGTLMFMGTGQDHATLLGTDTLVGNSGAATIATGTNDAVLFLGTGTSSVDVGAGGHTSVVGSSGSDTITTHGGALVFLGSAQNQVTSLGADTVVGGGGAATISTGANDAVLFLGQGSTSVNTGAGGHAVVVAQGGSDTIVTHGGASVWLGSGPALVTTLGTDTVVGGSGAATVSTAAGNALVVAGSGNMQVATGSGTTQVLAGTGAETVIAGAGADQFSFISGNAGTADIQGFDPTRDVIALGGYAAGEAANAVAGATIAGGSETIMLSDGTRITFEGFIGLTTSNFA